MIRVLGGDCRAVLTTLPPDCLDACVTDPPYELAFMGRRWDSTGVAFDPATWRTVYRVLKPGAYLVAFGGTRTYHRMVCAIEDAGFEIRDTLCWLYGSGFPKSHNLSGDWQGWGTALKPAHEPIVLARKPLSERTVAANVLAHGVGGLNIDACRVATDETITATRNIALGSSTSGVYGAATVPGVYEQQPGGRWPANVLHDGSAEVMDAFAAFGERPTSKPRNERGTRPGGFGNVGHGKGTSTPNGACFGDTGTAARFFYSSKANKADRAGSSHPTVKPIALMRWLTRLVTPPGGHVLDPFAGSGTPGEAAMLEGFDCTMIEQDAAYRDDIAARMAAWPGRDGPLFATVAAE